MLNKTIVVAGSLLAMLFMTGPGAANVDMAVVLRPAFDSSSNWLRPVTTLSATGGTSATMGVRSAVVLEASLTPEPPVQAPHNVPPAGDYGLFGSVALPIATLPASKQWRRVSTTDYTSQYGARCRSIACSSGISALLVKAAQKADGRPTFEALSLINSSVNHLIRYRADRSDHWASPVETAARGAGDCEDFAIAKLWLLRSIGYTPEQLQLVILRDARTGIFHAVLAVHANGERYILDNLSNRVLTDDVLKAYVPIESFAGDRAFIHGFSSKPGAAKSLPPSVHPAG